MERGSRWWRVEVVLNLLVWTVIFGIFVYLVRGKGMGELGLMGWVGLGQGRDRHLDAIDR